jgi:hypothetical protein
MATRNLPRFSILELFALILIPGLGIAAIRAGGIFISAALLSGMLWFIAMAIVSLFGHGSLRRFAGGFVVASGIYGGLLLYLGESELQSYAGSLPTSQALYPLQEAMTTYTYREVRTKRLLTEDEIADAKAGQSNLLVSVSADPDNATLMTIGHLLVGLLFGYLGGKFALALDRPVETAAGPTAAG